MKKIIIESKYSIHQKLMFILMFFFTFLIGGSHIILIVLGLYDQFDENIVYKIVYPLLFPFSIYIFILFFSKQGILIEKDSLFYSQFFFDRPFSKKEIKLNGITDTSILTYNIQQKFAFFSAAKPDLAENVSIKKVFLLNEKHTKKEFVLSTKKIESANKIIEEINKEFNFKFKKYSPPRVRQRRR